MDPRRTHWLKRPILITKTLDLKDIAYSILKLSLFNRFCSVDWCWFSSVSINYTLDSCVSFSMHKNCFWTSLVHAEHFVLWHHCLVSVTFCPGHGTKMWLLKYDWDIKEISGLLVFTIYCYNILFLQECYTGHDVVICNVLFPWCHKVRNWRLSNNFNLSKHIF